MSTDWVLRRQMIQVARRLDRAGFFPGPSGNLSIRLSAERFLVTPSGVAKGQLHPEELLIVDAQGQIVEGIRGMRPTSELPMHLEAYRRRPDIGAVVHAHPAACIALTLAGVDLTQPVLPEVVLLLGPVPTTPYATPSSEENRLAIADFIATHDALLLARHGSLTVGRTIEEAATRLEILEHAAQTLVWAQLLGGGTPLPPEAVRKLETIRAAYLNDASKPPAPSSSR